MRAAAMCCALGVAGCTTQGGGGQTPTGPFLLDTADCALVNNFTLDGAATKWTDCRVHWTDEPTRILTVELTVPNTTGSFLSPGADWIRASVHVPAGDLNGKLAIAPFEPFDELPTTVPDGKLPIDLWVGECGNISTTTATQTVDVMADVGATSAFFSMSLQGTCTRPGNMMSSFTGGFILTAAAQDGSMTMGDPATLVSPTE